MTAALQEYVHEQFGVEKLQDLDEAFLGEALSGFFAARGWGELVVGDLGAAVVTVNAADWAEAAPGGDPIPRVTSRRDCWRISSRDSRAASSRRWKWSAAAGGTGVQVPAPAPETLTLVYERMTHGMSYQAALGV